MSEIIEILRNLYDTRAEEIEAWFAQKRKEAAPFFYTSVDLRHSGKRLVPVDTNLFPAGFNNLSLAARSRASRYVAQWFETYAPSAKRVLIVPENHTRNLGYLENLLVLSDIIKRTGREVIIGSLSAETTLELQTLSGATITQTPITRAGSRLLAAEFNADVIILNNDLSGGMLPVLENLEQMLVPPVSMGWYQRKKSGHFEQYHLLAQEFAAAHNLDSWLLSAEFRHCGMVDFKERTNLERVAKNIEAVLNQAAKKHAQYGISEAPYVFVKADAGTYGMGIMTLTSPDEIFELNKKDRNKMQTIKEGVTNSEVIIQEGIPTIDVVDAKPAEPMVYMIDGVPVGGMYRVNGQRERRSASQCEI
jgi:glutamate--cysteine ligase